MPIKTSTLAGWCLLTLTVFLAAFYIAGGRMLALAGAWGPRVSIMLCEFVAFAGGALLLRGMTRDRSMNRRLRPPSRVYASFSIFAAISAALGIFLLTVAAAKLMNEPYNGIDSLYPMLRGTAVLSPAVTILTLVFIPAVVQEILLRGALFSLYERRGTAAAVTMSAIMMPIIYAYPSAAPFAVTVGLVCGLLAYCTNSLWGGVLTHILCRLALYGGDMLYASPAMQGKTAYVVAGVMVLFFLFVFSLLRSTEGLLRDGLLERFKRGKVSATESLWRCMKSSGFALAVVLYITRVVMILLGRWH